MLIAALCISAVVASAPNASTAYQCQEAQGSPVATIHEQPLPKAVEPVPAAPAPVAAPAKAKPKARRAKHVCKAPKRSWYHRRGDRVWYTCA